MLYFLNQYGAQNDVILATLITQIDKVHEKDQVGPTNTI
jgi:hypothetical protein